MTCPLRCYCVVYIQNLINEGDLFLLYYPLKTPLRLSPPLLKNPGIDFNVLSPTAISNPKTTCVQSLLHLTYRARARSDPHRATPHKCQPGTSVHKVHVNCISHVTLCHLLTHLGCVYNRSL
jgi:hypothetical protein